MKNYLKKPNLKFTYFLTVTFFTCSNLELVFSVASLVLISNRFRRIPKTAGQHRRQLEVDFYRLFAVNAFLITFFFFLPMLANLLFYMRFGDKPLLYLLGPSIFAWYLPIHVLLNLFLSPPHKQTFSTRTSAPPEQEEHEMSLL
jgi:hypothetical protein